MNFRVDRASATRLPRSSVVLTMAMAAALLLASCGGSGSSSQSRQFHPTRMIVFGDEASLLLPALTPNGVDRPKYGINGFNPFATTPSTTPDCRANLLWVQLLASEYNLVFAECNPVLDGLPNGRPVSAQMRATVGAKVEGAGGAVEQIDTFLASNSVGPRDLITLMVGTHDIIELYERVLGISGTALTRSAALAEAQRRARVVSAQVDRMTNNSNTRGRVIYATVPDVGRSAFATGLPSDRVQLLRDLSETFNNTIRATVTVNGRSIGSLNAYQLLRNIYDSVQDGNRAANFVNVRDAACTTPNVLDCTSATLQPAIRGRAAATELNWLWAQDYYLSAGGQGILGADAVDLAGNLPF